MVANMLMERSVGIWGFVMQNATYAIVGSIWCIIHLSTSPLISSRHTTSFLVDVPNVIGIAIAVSLGYVLPAILMSLPAPSIVNHDLKQWLMTVWQIFPIWVSIIQGIVSYLLSKVGVPSKASTTHKLRSMKVLYAGLLTVAGIGQISTITLVATSKFFPALFAPEYVGVFDFSTVFLPVAITPSTKMPSIGAGALLLFQYDQGIGSTSMALWSTVLFINTYRNGTTRQNGALMIAGGIILMALTGPLGYATACIWARDELIIADAEIEGKKAQ